ncbi:MAG: glycerophosphodiester phosphodiesterase family protein [Bacteroides sp.]|nr:glycerophosphodiester phosphodiesterase family protein [Bacteroides sp.]
MSILEKGFRGLLLFVSVAGLYSCGTVAKLPSEVRGYPLVSGHRGANCIAPENTMASLDSCIRYGVDVMELDVAMSSDSVFFLLHDWTLDRTTNGTGKPGDYPAAVLDTLDAGAWFGPEWAGQKLPRFAEILRKAHDGGVDITIDYRDGRYRDLVDLLKAEDMLERTSFTFGREEDVKAFREEFPEIKKLQAYVRNLDDFDRIMAELKPDVIVCRINLLTPEFVKKCHSKGLQVLALCLGLDDMTEANQKAVDLKVDVVATDRPVAFRRQFDYDSKGL